MMGRSGVRSIGLALTMAALGCGPVVLPEGFTESESGSEGEGSSTGPISPPLDTTMSPPPPPPPPETTTTTSPPPPSDESTTGESSLSFLSFGDTPEGTECDLFAQDCPRGEKCIPWANDGGDIWNALRCSPVDESPDGVGEPCTVEGSGVSGIDSCDYGSMCFYVDPETNEGECVAFCVGSPENPLCEDANASCAINGDGTLALCIPNCDPLLQDCAEGQACYPVNDTFQCGPDASGDMGAAGDPCEFINVCDPGTFCANAEAVPECAGAVGCCTPFCDVSLDPSLVCLPGQECMSWWEPGNAPPGHENVGACVLPM